MFSTNKKKVSKWSSEAHQPIPSWLYLNSLSYSFSFIFADLPHCASISFHYSMFVVEGKKNVCKRRNASKLNSLPGFRYRFNF